MKLNSAAIEELIKIARAAGAVTQKYFRDDGLLINNKDDDSPVTIADQEAESLIVEALSKLFPDIPIVGEELTAAGHAPDVSNAPAFWLVDALDGTKEFIRGKKDYTVNIALIVNKKPVFGIVYAPALGELFVGDVAVKQASLYKEDGTKTLIHVRPIPTQGLTIVGSARHGNSVEMQKFLKGQLVHEFCARGSSLKFCEIAAGRADIYPRFGPTCEWDIAAGDAVLRAAGGVVTDSNAQNAPMLYAKKHDFYNPHFIAWGALRPK